MDKKTIDIYNKFAKEYDEETLYFWQEFPITFLDKFVGSVSGDKILNIGSGSGHDALLLKDRGLDVICLDASQSMINLSKQKGLKSILGDFNNLPFSDNHFDGVWAYTSLLHISKSDIQKPIKEVYRVLKKEGVFALGLIEGRGEVYMKSKKIKESRFFALYSKKEIEKLLRDNNFEIIYFEEFRPRTKNYLNYISKKI